MKSKKYGKIYRRKYISKRKKRGNIKRIRKSKKIRKLRNNQNGAGIPFAGTLSGLVGLTHNKENNVDGLIENLCLVNSLKNPVKGDVELHNLINQLCNANHNIKKTKKNSGLVSSAFKLIGNVATLPLRTASKAVTSITGVNPSEMITNAIKNSSMNEENKDPYKTAPTVEDLKKLDEKIKRGGSFDSNDLKVINSLQKS
jgi:hypothetical protein